MSAEIVGSGYSSEDSSSCGEWSLEEKVDTILIEFHRAHGGMKELREKLFAIVCTEITSNQKLLDILATYGVVLQAPSKMNVNYKDMISDIIESFIENFAEEK